MAVGDRTVDSVIWVPGEATGKDIYGQSVSLPTGPDTDVATGAAGALASATSALNALKTRLVASGVLPSV